MASEYHVIHNGDMTLSETIRDYLPDDEASWLRCRALSFLGTQYYDDVRAARSALDAPTIELVATIPTPSGETVVGILDIEIDGEAATIDTIATHPDYQGRGIGTRLLEAALPTLCGLGAVTLDAWTREDVAANRWYQRHGFFEKFRYLHVYLGDDDNPEGFATPEGLSMPVAAFVHAPIEHERHVRSRYTRTYVCRQYLRQLDGVSHSIGAD